MSDADDRMERAERIRKLRQARDPGDEESEGAAASEDEADANDDEANAGPDEGDASQDEADAGDDDGRGEKTAAGGDVAAERGDGVAEGGDESAATDSSATDSDVTNSDVTDSDVTATAVEESQYAAADIETGDGDTTTDAAPTAGGGLAPLGGTAGFSLPGQEETAAAAGEDGAADAGDGADGTPRGRAGAATDAAGSEPSVRVLEFTVGEQTYCFDIARVEEIVKRETITRVPNTEDYVEGIVDLRGQITTILDTKRLLDVEETGRESLLVIFAPDAFEDHGSVGWVVDEVRQVVPVTDSQVRTHPGDDDHVRGVVDRDDENELILWIRPGVAMSRAVTLAGVDSPAAE